jgi:hypothetical protein
MAIRPDRPNRYDASLGKSTRSIWTVTDSIAEGIELTVGDDRTVGGNVVRDVGVGVIAGVVCPQQMVCPLETFKNHCNPPYTYFPLMTDG